MERHAPIGFENSGASLVHGGNRCKNLFFCQTGGLENGIAVFIGDNAARSLDRGAKSQYILGGIRQNRRCDDRQHTQSKQTR